MSTPPLLHAAASLRRYAGEYAAHAHDHAQLLLGLRGGLQLEAAGHAALVEAGTAIVVPAGVAHAYRADRPSNVLVIDAPMRRGLERVRRGGSEQIDGTACPVLTRLIAIDDGRHTWPAGPVGTGDLDPGSFPASETIWAAAGLG